MRETGHDTKWAESQGGGGGILSYMRYIGMCRRVWFLSRFGLKTGIDFQHFGLKLGMVIGGAFTKTYKLIFSSQQPGRVTG